MSTIFELANQLAIMAAGRRPAWATQSSFSGAPATTSAGLPLNDAISTLVSVSIREEVHRRKAIVTAPVFDAATTYNVIIAGFTNSAVTPADEDTLITTLRDNINGDVNVNTTVTATALDADGVDVVTSGNPATQLQILGDIEADWSIDVTYATGTGTLMAVADPSSATMRLYGRERAATGTTAPESWRALLLNGVDYDLALGYRGHLERYETGGIDRFYVELDSIAGDAGDGSTDVSYSNPVIKIGPTSTGG